MTPALGSKVRDSCTGFEGILVAVQTDYLGSTLGKVEALGNDGIHSEWIQIERLEATG